jgi:6-phosphogluconolactonase (cycloisomerase 2 family)
VICIFGLILILGNAAMARPGQDRKDDEDRTPKSGRVYIMPNRAAGNTIMVFNRADDGGLTFLAEVPTGGLGSGPGELPAPFPVGPGPNPLTSQDDLIITEDGRFLLAVNAHSNDMSVLAVTEDGLQLTDRVPTRGIFPVSIAAHKGLIYVLNEGQDPARFIGGIPTITGFHLTRKGKLIEIPNSTRPTGDPNAEPADVVFSRDGESLIIPDKFAGTLIHVFHVEEDGSLEETFNIPANTPTPFGAAFTHHGILVVVEANAGLVNGRRQGVVDGATMSSYRLTEENTLEPISKAVPMNQTVGCWVRFTPNGHYAFVTNTGDGSVSSYKVSDRGELTLLAARAADTGGPFSGPVDEDITPDGRFLYVVSGFSGELKGYRIGDDGSLTPVASVKGLTRESLVGTVSR